MKLILGNNQSDKFTAYYEALKAKASFAFDYTGYESLIFVFDTAAEQPVMAKNLATNRLITEYDGVYINNYLNTYEIAAATAIVLEKLGISYANHEFSNPVSLSKLTEYARLAAAGVTIPATIAGAKAALLAADADMFFMGFPCVLKRADADRGIDNFMVSSYEQMVELLADQGDRSLWVVQAFVPNDGYFRIGYNGGQPGFAIFRSLQARQDGNELKRHMYKPKGGSNAALVPLTDVPGAVMDLANKAVKAVDRQFAGVDCLYQAETDTACIIEVNYNPQMVTVESYTDVRQEAFLKGLENL